MALNSKMTVVIPSEEYPYVYMAWLYSYLETGNIPIIITKYVEDLEEKSNLVFIDLYPDIKATFISYQIDNERKTLSFKNLAELWKTKFNEPSTLLAILDTNPKNTKFDNPEDEEKALKHIGMISRNFNSLRNLSTMIKKNDMENSHYYTLSYISGIDSIVEKIPKDDAILDNSKVVKIMDYNIIVINIDCWAARDKLYYAIHRAVMRSSEYLLYHAIMITTTYNDKTYGQIRTLKKDVKLLEHLAGKGKDDNFIFISENINDFVKNEDMKAERYIQKALVEIKRIKYDKEILINLIDNLIKVLNSEREKIKLM